MRTIFKQNDANPITYQQASDVLTESGIVFTGLGTINGIFGKTDGTNNLTIVVYDGADDTGKQLLPTIFIEGDQNNFSLDFGDGILASDGLYVDITVAGEGGTCELQIYYRD